MKKIVVINGHPDQESFNAVIAESYINSAKASGAEVRYIAIGQLNFNPNLQFGYRQRMELEPDLVKALDDIQWSDHQVWIHPVWWLGMPAIMKGFFDRAFLPGITFKSDKKGNSEGLLNAKSARIITTAGDLSLKLYEDEYQSSGLIQLKKGILEYCGVSSIENHFIGPLYELTEKERKEWLDTITGLAITDSL
ncbi:NAD(P)H-dependent oxidoreductase [Chryseobacterium jejuense]|uniref:NADPH-quinone reductase (Modulator of drug activity B) n=1 Tax=Chryseobacterium jejuense TaxID=445960 RepID=A0A2X2XKJ4_CHRJE|nr:NAD(P)H-dependent oxidoreductase [Chryseobacterium jejuense]SDI37122.1 Putative NADPH-quinone reductase (modulator of drug activity B) [Chryseobacterium jejuense]SQB26860.1 Putative NADPH-quinone reductase (modulator of drug activity B) [Chryseobacterium jejuense]